MVATQIGLIAIGKPKSKLQSVTSDKLPELLCLGIPPPETGAREVTHNILIIVVRFAQLFNYSNSYWFDRFTYTSFV